MNFRTYFCFAGVACAVFSFGQVHSSKLRSSQAAPQAQAMVALSQVEIPSAIGRSTLMGHTNPAKLIRVTISMPYGDPAGMQTFADSVSNPESPNFRQFIEPDEVGARFGLSSDKVSAITGYLQSQGFAVKTIAKNHLTISAQGTVAQAEAAFGTVISDFKSKDPNEKENPNFFSFTTPVHVPSNIAPNIVAVSGLQNYTKPEHRILTPLQARVLDGLAPIYNAGFRGQGRTVAISSWDGFRLTNVPLYYAKYGLPTPAAGVGSNITVIPVDGGTGASTASGEGDIDIQMVLGMAPLCNFIIYDGGFSGGPPLIDVLSQEANDNLADIVSESYGWDLSADEATAAHNIHLSMTAQGMTYMAATGDDGTSGLTGRFQYSDYDPEVLLVGGTVPTVDATGNRISEVGWAGSGGGWTLNAATFNSRPSWQVGTGVPSINKRLSPDVALAASGNNNSGAYYFFFNGALNGGFVGTSFACPVFAGQLASAEQRTIANGGLPPNLKGKRRVGRIQDIIYRQNGKSSVWTDIVAGSNGSLPGGGSSSCHVGWDTVTGWGVINWNAMNLATTTVLPLNAGFVGVVEGTGLNGPTNVNFLDNFFYRITPQTVGGLGQVASAAYRFNLPITVPRTSISELDFTAITRFANGSTGQLYMFNWGTGKWDLMKSYAMSSTAATNTAALKTSFSTYISAAGEYRVLVRGLLPITAGVTGNSFDTDYFASKALYVQG